jgi:hypothetical protein
LTLIDCWHCCLVSGFHEISRRTILVDRETEPTFTLVDLSITIHFAETQRPGNTVRYSRQLFPGHRE